MGGGHGDHGMEGKATEEDMVDAQVPVAFRDSCAHLLIPLNKCRRLTMFVPWECSHERHIYEKCQYLDFKDRKALMKESKEES